MKGTTSPSKLPVIRAKSAVARVASGFDGAMLKAQETRALATTSDNVQRAAVIGSQVVRQAKQIQLAEKGLYTVTIKGNLKRGLRTGKYTWNGVNATVHGPKGIAGQIKVKRVSSVLSNAMCNVAGEFQMAQILAAVERVEEKVDQIRKEMSIERRANLSAAIEMVQDALHSEDAENKKHLLYDSIHPLRKGIHEYRDLAKGTYERAVSRSFSRLVIDGVFGSSLADEKYAREMADWLKEMNDRVYGYAVASYALAQAFFLLNEPRRGADTLADCCQGLRGQIADIAARLNFQLNLGLGEREQYELPSVLTRMRRLKGQQGALLRKVSRGVQSELDSYLLAVDSKAARPVEIECRVGARQLQEGV